ncbi:glutathione S-transferase C-terminal domain-containing protein [Nasonia vitripennis]|uniref:Methyltransferase domain-containing protein n=1 Tax=Nasonia vitripennis TaxID=7425 RepID=A0A7M6UWT9_NASVI|nr:glutathione S-transferase C-terminal domain-containing protein [Nasonia vitripennis]
MAKVYLKVFSVNELCQVPIETLVTLFTIKYCNSDVQIRLVRDANVNAENSFVVDISTFQYEFIEYSKVSEIASCCELPNLEENDKSCIAGLCATLRQIIRNMLVTDPEHYSRSLLGFKESCLLACSEASIWTRFCEVDIVSTLKSTFEQNQDGILPMSLARFEKHMSQPVRLHNIYKYTMSKKFTNNVQQDKSTLPEHTFAEGLTLTLADIIIFICIHTLFTFIDRKQIRDIIPLTMKWYENMLTDEHNLRSLDILCIENSYNKGVMVNYSLPHTENQSLYKSDPKRYKPRSRIYTRQDDIDYSLGKIKDHEVPVKLDDLFGQEKIVDWSAIPHEATPAGGDLPNTRLQRKFQQLESLCKPVLKLAKDGDTIVDFCSGGGHLGILLAYLLPKCNIILLENKAESMKKAKDRVVKLSLNNVIFYQSNLDYFKGHFDIGTCLHACGVATDLVLQQCIDKNAAFVCCPCCYGSVQDCHRIVYPRSQVVKDVLDNRSYLVLGHSADQTHDVENVKTKQGYECMMVIDTDRKMQAEENGYQVYLNKLTPETCSPKNHLLVGWPSRLRN